MECFPAPRWTGIGWAAEPKLPTLPIRWLRSTSESAVSARTLGIIFRGLYCRGTDCRADRSQAINARHFHGAGDLDDYGHPVLLQLAFQDHSLLSVYCGGPFVSRSGFWKCYFIVFFGLGTDNGHSQAREVSKKLAGGVALLSD